MTMVLKATSCAAGTKHVLTDMCIKGLQGVRQVPIAHTRLQRNIITSTQKELEFSVSCPSLSGPIWSHLNFSIQSASQAIGTCKPKQEQGKGVLQI